MTTCRNCLREFERKRPWQMDCSTKCNSDYHNRRAREAKALLQERDSRASGDLVADIAATAAIDDPHTSSEHAARQNADGSLRRHCERALQWLERSPGATSAELARLANVERHQMAKWVAALKSHDLAHQGDARRCKVSKQNAVTWFAGPNPKPLSLAELADYQVCSQMICALQDMVSAAAGSRTTEYVGSYGDAYYARIDKEVARLQRKQRISRVSQ